MHCIIISWHGCGRRAARSRKCTRAHDSQPNTAAYNRLSTTTTAPPQHRPPGHAQPIQVNCAPLLLVLLSSSFGPNALYFHVQRGERVEAVRTGAENTSGRAGQMLCGVRVERGPHRAAVATEGRPRRRQSCDMGEYVWAAWRNCCRASSATFANTMYGVCCVKCI